LDSRAKLEAAYRAHGIDHPALLDSYLRGCNFNQPVEEIELAPGAFFAVYVKDGYSPGKHGAPLDMPPATLGIMMDGRHREVFEVVDSFAVVQSTAADFPFGLVQGVGGQGGGLQYVLPPGWRSKVRRLS